MDIKTAFPYLIHLGALLYLICFLFRNQVILRSFAIAGDLAYTAYFFAAAEHPLWDAMFWSTLNIIINTTMILLILRDNKSTGFSDDELRLFRKLGSIGPREFRKLARLAKWGVANGNTRLSAEGEPQEALHYILDGTVDIAKSGRSFNAGDGMFIGEIAFLKKRNATATVTLENGAQYVSWKHSDLEKAQARDDSFRNALLAMLTSDLAEKVARS